MKTAREEFEEVLNDLGTPDHDHPENGGRVPWDMIDCYGTWLKLHDPIAFNVGANEWEQAEEIQKHINIDEEGAERIAKEAEKEHDRFKYQMLSRLKQDCDYYLGNGNRCDKHLYELSPEKQIAEMKKLYNELPAKPLWLTMEQIEEYERQMTTKNEHTVTKIISTRKEMKLGAFVNVYEDPYTKQKLEGLVKVSYIWREETAMYDGKEVFCFRCHVVFRGDEEAGAFSRLIVFDK